MCYDLGVVEAVHVRRVRRASLLLPVVPLLLRPGDQEQDIRGDCLSVFIVKNE